MARPTAAHSMTSTGCCNNRWIRDSPGSQRPSHTSHLTVGTLLAYQPGEGISGAIGEHHPDPATLEVNQWLAVPARAPGVDRGRRSIFVQPFPPELKSL